MPGDSSVAQFSSYTKVLIVLGALVACSVKSVTAKVSTRDETIDIPSILDSRNAAYASLSVQRYLRSTNDKTSDSEERVGLKHLHVPLMSNLQTGLTKIDSSWIAIIKRLQMIRLKSVFVSWRLHKNVNYSLFKDPQFIKFLGLVESKYPKNVKKQAEEVYKIVSKYCNPDELAELLQRGMNTEKKELAGTMLGLQVTSWIGEKSVEDVFNLLKIGEIEDGSLLAGQRFSQFTSFFSRSFKSQRNVDEKLYAFLYKNFGDRLGRLLGESSFEPGPVVHRLQAMQLEKWKDNKVSADDVYKLLDLKPRYDLFRRGTGMYLLKYLYLLNENDTKKIFDFLRDKFDGMFYEMLDEANENNNLIQPLIQRVIELSKIEEKSNKELHGR